MNDLSEFLGERELQQALGLRVDEMREVAQWGLLKRPGDPGFRSDRVQAWLDVSARFPGVLLNEKFAAALVGLSVSEFRRRMDIFQSARTSFDEGLFWKASAR